MTTKRYTLEFKVEAVKQVTDRGHSVADDASRLGISIHSLYAASNTPNHHPRIRRQSIRRPNCDG